MSKKMFMLIPPPGSSIPTYVTAVDAAGRSIFSDGLPVGVPSNPCVNIASGIECTDRLLTAGNELVLSERAISVLSRHRLDPRLVRCPLKLTSKAVEPGKWPHFELCYSITKHDVLHNEAKVRTIKGHVLSVFEWVVDRNAIPPFDFFLAPANRWIATEQLVDSIYDARLTGFGFAVIPCRS